MSDTRDAAKDLADETAELLTEEELREIAGGYEVTAPVGG